MAAGGLHNVDVIRGQHRTDLVHIAAALLGPGVGFKVVATVDLI